MVLVMSCKTHSSKMPVWNNSSDTIVLADAQLVFTTNDKNWEATLLTFIQPIKLSTAFINGKLSVSVLHKTGVVEGPAQICLSSGSEHFYYPVFLVNKNQQPIAAKEYRSSKTVNPDSSLTQQRMIHKIDINRNLVALNKKNQFFFEGLISVSPKTGIYHIVKKEGLSAFYVQPGSCVSIPLKAVFENEKKSFSVTAGPLKDAYGNLVANGTMVAFDFNSSNGVNRQEVPLLNGYATIILPLIDKDYHLVQAMVNETVSKKIFLIH